jgi:hypothetical protein
VTETCTDAADTTPRRRARLIDVVGACRQGPIIANHRARLFGSGIADRTALEYLGAVLGEEQIQRVATHRQRLEIARLARSAGSRMMSGSTIRTHT